MPDTAWISIVVMSVVAASGATGMAVADPAVTNVEYTGENAVQNTGDQLHLWQSRPHEFTVSIDAGSSTDEICVRLPEGEPLTCREFDPKSGETDRLELQISTLPSTPVGETALVFELGNRSSEAVMATTRLPVTVLAVDEDPDGDELRSGREVEVGTSPVTADTDGDGLDDGAEVRVYSTDPTMRDTDGDGLNDGAEVRTHRTDPASVDTDGDGLADGIEVRQGTDPNAVDTDGDGLEDGAELTTYGTNATLIDTDGDGLDDGAEIEVYDTDPTVADTDGDGIDDGAEIELYDTDPREVDTDDDGLDDQMEIERGTDPTKQDTDGDGLDDDAEIEIYGTDPRAADTDSDGLTDGREVERGTDPTAPTVQSPGPLATVFDVMSLPVVAGLVIVGFTVGAAVLLTTIDGLEEWGRGVLAGFGREGTETGMTGPEDATVLTNEERVTRLLEQNDGRMRQSDMVEAADWSKATVSRVLSDMEDANAVIRIDMGHGNLVALPEAVPDGAKSPLSDEE